MYLQLGKSLPDLDPDAALFRRPTKSGYANSPIGRNMLGRVGVAIAEELGLKNPKKYTGHCFRRTAATVAANHGATSLDLKRHMGWRNEKTALRGD